MRTNRANESYQTRCRQYEAEKRKLVGLSPKEYEEAVKKLAEKYHL